MNHSGDAAEQIVRMSLEGVEVAARITGSAAKEIALFLFAALKSKDKNLKLKGRARLTAMLKSGKALEIYSVREGDLQKFVQGAKEYGIVYCVLRNTKNAPDGLCDIMVKTEDAPKITRLAERFQFATVDKAKIESELVAEKAGRAAADRAEGAEPEATEINDTEALLDDLLGAEPEAPDINDTEKLLDDLLGERSPRETAFRGERRSDGVSELSRRNAEARDTKSATTKGKAAPEPPQAAQEQAGKEAIDNSPLAGGAPPKTNPSAPTSGSRSSSARDILSRPSVKGELREIAATRAGLAARKAKEADAPVHDDKALTEKPKDRPAATTHQQPPRRGGKPKSKKSKGSR